MICTSKPRLRNKTSLCCVTVQAVCENPSNTSYLPVSFKTLVTRGCVQRAAKAVLVESEGNVNKQVEGARKRESLSWKNTDIQTRSNVRFEGGTQMHQKSGVEKGIRNKVVRRVERIMRGEGKEPEDGGSFQIYDDVTAFKNPETVS